MATEVAAPAVNGSYAGHAEDPALAAARHGDAGTTTAADGGDKPYPAEQVAWLFLERYYTTLSHDPEKLYLFYNKRSHFIYGIEEEKVPVCIGQRQINERIKQIDCQFAKVRITNVDSQASDNKILIQVIGEMSLKSSTKAEPPRRFVQSFILAEQSNGYFVLNDIFRSLKDEDEEFVEEPAAAAATPEEAVATPEAAAAPVEDPAKVEDSAEGAKEEAPAKEPQVNGKVEPEAAPAKAEAAPAAVEPAAESTKEVTEPEKPKETKPTPAQAKPAAAATPAAPPKPAAPKTWASLAASANKVATPAIPTPSPAAPKAAAPKAEAAAPAAAAGASAPAPAAAKKDTTAEAESADGWQTAGAEQKKVNRQSTAPPSGGAQGDASVARAYIKNVFENVDADALRKALEKFGVVYCDISRSKNCAFVDFATQAGFTQAVAANPHQVGSDSLFVEERRVRPAGGFFGGRGGMGPRGRGGLPERGGRGGASGRGRGGASGGRGRGGQGPSA